MFGASYDRYSTCAFTLSGHGVKDGRRGPVQQEEAIRIADERGWGIDLDVCTLALSVEMKLTASVLAYHLPLRT